MVVVNGARQTGKSTLAQSLADATVPEGTPRQYLTLDDAVVLNAAKSDPAGFINGLTGPVTLDEVQRAPELFLAIKANVNRHRQPGRYLLTGSADVMLLPGIADSLAGRVEVLSLWPMSSAELAGSPTLNRADCLFNGNLATLAAPTQPLERSDAAELAGDAKQNPRNALIERLVAGGFPDAVTRSTPRRRAAWFDSYVQSVLQRDVRDLAHIEQLTEIPNLLQLLAARSASLLNFAELARSSGLPQSTLKRYFALLEMLFLVVRVSPWERNAAKRLVKAPKVFLPDSGLLCHLMGETAASLAAKAGPPGAAVETYVLAELLKHIAFSAQRLSLWHYRTQNHIEVDFILENRQGQITGIEVKASSTVDSKDFKGLRHLQTTEPTIFQRGIVLYAGRDVVPFEENLWAVPLGVWWSERSQT